MQIKIINKTEDVIDYAGSLEEIVDWCNCSELYPTDECSSAKELAKELSNYVIIDAFEGREIDRKVLAKDIVNYVKLKQELDRLDSKWRQ